MKASLKNTALSEVCEVIAACMGLHFPVERWDILARNLASAAIGFGFQDIDEFIHWLLSANLKKRQIELLASYITTTETFFWREPNVFSAFTDFILPEFIASKKNGEKNIRIWSAGCSTGEEPYSLAIALHKTIPDIKDWDILILATDINPRALNKAVSGIYSSWSFRNCPAWLKSNYFHHLGNRNYEILPEIRKLVTFANLNLTEEIYPSQANNTHAIDIIFCRNVMMYFTEEWVSKISQKLYQSLSKDGWIVVSSCELSSQVFQHFIPVNFPGAILYRKGNKEILSSLNGTKHVFVHDIPFPVVTALPVITEPVFHFSIPVSNIAPSHKVAITATDEKDVATAPETDSAHAAAVKIRLLANQGNLPEALSLCNEGIAADKLATGLYFLRASILQELDKTSEAIASLRQAIYLDPNFIMGHFALGNLYLRQGKPKNAKRYFDNVLDLLSVRSNDDILPESDGLSVKYIREIILTNMQKHTIL